ncbi:MAG: hypothetical protein FWG88_02700 [Oscillospiraceae bacterium]|nr:hypothetical protein [Oscillospiraceae bacterium]
MWTIILAMERIPIAQVLEAKLLDFSDVQVISVADYVKAASIACSRKAQMVLFEIAEWGEYDADYCLFQCARLRSEAPDCGIILLCPETDESSVAAAVHARLDGIIDDFVFYDASTDFLVSKLLLGRRA